MRIPAIRYLLLTASLAGMAGLGTRAVWAQDSLRESSSKRDPEVNLTVPDTRVDAQTIASISSDETASSDSKPTYVPVLNRDQLLSMGSGPRFRFLYGSKLTEAYNSFGGQTAGNTFSQSGSLSALTPLVGIMGHSPRADYILQYSPTLSYLNTNRQLGSFHQFSADARGEFNNRWGWDFTASNRYGQDSLRFIEGLSFQSLGDVPVASASNAAFLFDRQLYYTGESLGVHFKISERQRIRFTTHHTYYTVVGSGGGHLNQAGFDADFQRDLTRKLSIDLYGRTGENFSQNPCTYGSVGGGLTMHPTERLFLGLGIGRGRGRGSTGCSTLGGQEYYGAVSYLVSRASTVYIDAARRLNAPALLPRSQTRDDVTAGYSRRLRRNLQVRLDGGYSRILDSPSLSPASGHGYFVGSQAGWQFSRTVSLVGSYNHYFQNFGRNNVGRNQVLVSLEWRPTPRGLYR